MNTGLWQMMGFADITGYMDFFNRLSEKEKRIIGLLEGKICPVVNELEVCSIKELVEKNIPYCYEVFDFASEEEFRMYLDGLARSNSEFSKRLLKSAFFYVDFASKEAHKKDKEIEWQKLREQRQLEKAERRKEAEANRQEKLRKKDEQRLLAERQKRNEEREWRRLQERSVKPEQRLDVAMGRLYQEKTDSRIKAMLDEWETVSEEIEEKNYSKVEENDTYEQVKSFISEIFRIIM